LIQERRLMRNIDSWPAVSNSWNFLRRRDLVYREKTYFPQNQDQRHVSKDTELKCRGRLREAFMRLLLVGCFALASTFACSVPAAAVTCEDVRALSKAGRIIGRSSWASRTRNGTRLGSDAIGMLAGGAWRSRHRASGTGLNGRRSKNQFLFRKSSASWWRGNRE